MKTQILFELINSKQVSLRGLRDNAKLFDELIFDINSDYFEKQGGYEFAKEFYEKAFHFAEEVILVEGEEQILIPEIVKGIYGKNILNNNDISIVKVGGKTYFDIYRKVLNELKIKNYIIADYDIINRGIDSLLDDEKHKVAEIRAKI